MLKKLIVLFTYLLMALLIYLYGESLLDWIRTGGTDYLLVTTVLAMTFALFPIIPYPIIGGILGATYGPFLGSMITWLGSSLASVMMFVFVRYGYQDWGQAILSRYQTLSKVTHLFERNGFMAVFIFRLLPVVPSIVVNIYSAVSKLSFISYTIASSIGKIPAMILFAVIGNTLFTNPGQLLFIVISYGIFLAIVYACYRIVNKLQLAKHNRLPKRS
ncbi:TVP38/TMEM64 family protein [Halalkalibacter urbisdiaboli]|uniref:TVP38/TMEM64 family protein n=1 Tax=Halalkalibacter urbisdiaboli TaxID=1960589 RepID=UPI000B443C11|nr:TVP38/TMEM64 family protein [Halalkalibacter urbisdiaboli]